MELDKTSLAVSIEAHRGDFDLYPSYGIRKRIDEIA